MKSDSEIREINESIHRSIRGTIKGANTGTIDVGDRTIYFISKNGVTIPQSAIDSFKKNNNIPDSETDRFSRDSDIPEPNSIPTPRDNKSSENNNTDGTSIPTKRICNKCGDSCKSKCSRCKKVYYCNRDCQKLDWKSHKLECNTSRT